mgnify:FL=1
MTDIFNRLSEVFYEYTEKYDKNIISLIKEKNIEVSLDEIKEILDDAKQRLK